MISVKTSTWSVVNSGVPHWLILGLINILFNIFIYVLDDGTECTLSKFVDDTTLGRMAAILEGCATIQSDLYRLEKWPNFRK